MLYNNATRQKRNDLISFARVRGGKLFQERSSSAAHKNRCHFRKTHPGDTHADAIAAIDLCVVRTLTFECLFVFLVISHGRRQLRHPTSKWLAQQIVEAFPWDTAPSYLVRDNDCGYGQTFKDRVRAMGIRDRPSSPRSPCQNPYVERLIGTLRRDCLDHVLIFGERNETRTHLGLGEDARPLGRAVERSGAVVAIPVLCGFLHRYGRI